MTAPGPSTAAASTTQVSVDLNGVDINDEAALSLAFTNAMETALDGMPYSVTHDPSTNSVVLRTTDGSGIRLRDGSGDDLGDAVIDVSFLDGSNTTSAAINTEFRFDNGLVHASDGVRYDAMASSADEIAFIGNGTGGRIAETSAGAGFKSAVITGTITATLEPGMVVRSDVAGTGTGGLFATNQAKQGSSILTLGGENGFAGFSSGGGETIEFELDGNTILFNTTSAASTSDIDLAEGLRIEIDAVLGSDYQVIRTGSAVSIIKDVALEDPINILNFADTT